MNPRIDTSVITSFDDVLKELRLLDQQLKYNGLDQLVTFTKAYRIITAAIRDATRDNYFTKPIFIEQFTVCFASYYFHAVNAMTSGSPELPAAWAQLRDVGPSDRVPQSFLLLLGANAHINHDLPLAMARYIDENADYSLRDARKVDRILMKCGRQIIPVINESSPLLNTLKMKLRLFYYQPVMCMILTWRIIAWRNFRAIQRSRPDSHEKRSIRIAKRLLRIGKLVARQSSNFQ